MRVHNHLKLFMFLPLILWTASGCDDSGGGGSSSAGVCGNGVLEAGEECDGDNLNGQSCESMGFARGDLGCSDTCTFDYKQCVSKSCGNGKIDEGEECDGDNFGLMTCQSFYYEGGEITCDETCHVDLSGCMGGTCDASQSDAFECTDDILNGYECSHVLQDGWCIIDDTCVPEGATSMENVCEACSPQDSTSSWTTLDGVPCPGTEGVCLGGHCLPDRDGDLTADTLDNCPGIANPDQLDTNDNGRGDECEVIALSAGEKMTCAVTLTGHVYCWGGEVARNVWMPELVTTESGTPLADITDVQVGHDHVCALDAGGFVWCWGNNTNGELGDGSLVSRDFPVQVITDANGTPLSSITGIGTGQNFSCAIDSGNRVWCWGRNTDYKVGNRTRGLSVRRASQVVSSGTFKTDVLAVGTNHVCVSEPNLNDLVRGRVRCWGLNEDGQLGNPDVSDATATAVFMEGWMPPSSGGIPGERPVYGVRNVSAGREHSCIVIYKDKDFGLMCTGDNSHHQITGDGTGTTYIARDVNVPGAGYIRDVSCGDYHTCILRSGRVYCWGLNDTGQVAQDTGETSVGPSATLAPVGTLTDDLTDIVAVSAGSQHSCAVDTSGNVWCWGSNVFGQLGADTADSVVPYAVEVYGLNSEYEY